MNQFGVERPEISFLESVQITRLENLVGGKTMTRELKPVIKVSDVEIGDMAKVDRSVFLPEGVTLPIYKRC